jgi:hypothetical protein
MKQPKEVLLRWIEVIETSGKNLTDWEKHFVPSVKDQLVKHGKVSEIQVEKLEGIYVDKTPN